MLIILRNKPGLLVLGRMGVRACHRYFSPSSLNSIQREHRAQHSSVLQPLRRFCMEMAPVPFCLHQHHLSLPSRFCCILRPGRFGFSSLHRPTYPNPQSGVQCTCDLLVVTIRDCSRADCRASRLITTDDAPIQEKFTLGLVQFPKNFAKFFRFPVTSNLQTHAWSIKYRRK